MVGHGGSSAGSYLADPTSPIPSHCASIVSTSHCNSYNTWKYVRMWNKRQGLDNPVSLQIRALIRSTVAFMLFGFDPFQVRWSLVSYIWMCRENTDYAYRVIPASLAILQYPHTWHWNELLTDTRCQLNNITTWQSTCVIQRYLIRFSCKFHWSKLWTSPWHQIEAYDTR